MRKLISVICLAALLASPSVAKPAAPAEGGSCASVSDSVSGVSNLDDVTVATGSEDAGAAVCDACGADVPILADADGLDALMLAGAEGAGDPMLASGEAWFPASGDRSSVREIHFVRDVIDEDSYDEVWNAGADEDAPVMCGRDGDVVYISTSECECVLMPECADGMFEDFSGLEVLDGLELADFSRCTSMQYFCCGCGALKVVDFGVCDMAGVTSLKYAFANCQKLRRVDLRECVFSSALGNISYMFYKCKDIREVDLSALSGGGITNVSHLFNGCQRLRRVDLDGFDTGAVTSSKYMFRSNSRLEEVSVGESFTLPGSVPAPDAAVVANCDGCWHGVGSGEVLSSLSGHEPCHETFVAYTQKDVPRIIAPDESRDVWTGTGVVRESVTAVHFADRYDGDFCDITDFDEGLAGDITIRIVRCSGDFGDGETGDEGDDVFVLEDDVNEGGVAGESIGRSAVETEIYIVGNGSGSMLAAVDSSSLFAGFTALSEITGLEMVDFSDTVTAAGMFADCSSMDDDLADHVMTDIGVNGITDFSMFFSNCDRITQVVIPEGFCSESASVLLGFFRDCDGLESVSLGGFGSGGITDVTNLLASCEALESVDVSGFDTGCVTSYDGMFSGDVHVSEIICDGAFTLQSEFPLPDPEFIEGAEGSWFRTAFAPDGSGWKEIYVREAYSVDGEWPAELSRYAAVWSERVPEAEYRMLTRGLSFTPSDVDRTSIRWVRFDPDFVPENGGTGSVVRSWNVDADDSGDVMAHLISDDDGPGIVVAFDDPMSQGRFEFNPDSSGIFSAYTGLRRIEGLEFCTGRSIRDASYMFHACNVLEEAETGGLIGSECTDITAMFYGCRRLDEIDVSGWDTSGVTRAASAMRECESLTAVDLSGLDLSALQDAGFMFCDDVSLSVATLSECAEFAPRELAAVPYMFARCGALRELRLDEWVCPELGDVDSFEYDDVEWAETLHESAGGGSGGSDDEGSGGSGEGSDEFVGDGCFGAYEGMFLGCVRLGSVTISSMFCGKDELPRPDRNFIPGASGKWYDSEGIGYAPGEIPNAAGTYVAVRDGCIFHELVLRVSEDAAGVYAPFGVSCRRYRVFPVGREDEFVTAVFCFDDAGEQAAGVRLLDDGSELYCAELMAGVLRRGGRIAVDTDDGLEACDGPRAIGCWGRCVAAKYAEVAG